MPWSERGVLIGIVLAAAAVRLLGASYGVQHPDEYSFAHFPLNFYSLDFNPHFFTYPTFHYYVLAVLFALVFIAQYLFGSGLVLEHFIALHYLYEPQYLVYWARLLSVAYGTGCVLLGAHLAGALYGSRARLPAAALLAVCTVQVRQSALAGVDTAALFFFAAALYASVRLLHCDDLRGYLLSGMLVGAAAACKYPAGLVGGAVVAAHLLARRPLFDLRPWLAAAISLVTFFVLSPYVLLDFHTFAAHFTAQFSHLGSGRGGDVGRGWWHHMAFSLPADGGWLALAALALAAALAVKERRAAVLVALVTFFIFYAVMGYGRTVFVRYALPLMFIQAVCAAGAVSLLVAVRWRVIATVALLAQPLHATSQQARLLAAVDTREQAREWIEEHIAPGEAIANFGGWAGDVPVQTYENLWWRLLYYERAFGRAALASNLDFLVERGLPAPHYSYALQRSNMDAQHGRMSEIEQRHAGWIVLHRHTLSYSQIDSSFARKLAMRAERVAAFGDGTESEEVYDPLDAFYVPLAGGGALERPGPRIEVWRLRDYSGSALATQTVLGTFAQAYVRGAIEAMNGGHRSRVNELTLVALDLDPRCAEAYYVRAVERHMAGDLKGAAVEYENQLALVEDSAALMNMALIYKGRGDAESERHALERAVLAAPWLEEPRRRLRLFERRQGAP